MLNDCPDPKEVSDFHFLQLRTLKIVKENEQISSKSINLITSASKYDLLFVGVTGGFKVLRLEDILTLDIDRENRSTLESFPFSFVPCDTPVLLAINATQTVLTVCTKSSATFYSLSNFSGFDSPWQPFCSKVISPPSRELQDFVWNPAVEGLYAFCLNDGSLHIDELSGTTIKSIANLPNANARAACWSPKGKQLVVGKQDGSFSQYKPNLDAVNTIMPPALEEGPVSVTSICWISTTVFVVVYVANDTPNLFIVSTPKNAAITYTNFNDVCLGNSSIPDQKYLIHFEPSWGLLICASLDSIEIAVLGGMPNWVQWDLKEDGKALLPGKDGASSAVGMTVMYSAQKQILISESVSYPPMPILFLLTNNGLLVSFHMVNETADAPTLVSAPVPLAFKMCSGNGLSLGNASSRNEELTKNKFLPSAQPLISSPSAVIGKNTAVSQIPSPANLSQNVSHRPEASPRFTHSDGLENRHNLPGNQPVMTGLNKSEAILSSSTSGKKSQLQISPPSFASEKENEIQSNADNSYKTAIVSEIQSFEKELQDLKQLQSSLPAMSNMEEDMMSLTIFALNLQTFQKDISETMQSLNSDIYTLKNALLESFVLFEEACSRERRRNDHSYITMLKERALDPITARHMQKLNQLFQYLSIQLQEVNNKLDQDWILHMSDKRKMSRNSFCISSTEAIYKTIVNNQKIIYNLKKKVDMLLKKAEAKKLSNITNSSTWMKHHKRLPQEDLSKLADEFLQVKITHQDEGERFQTKKLSSESQNVLKDFLKKSSIVTVRPTAVYSPSQSRLLSNTIPSDDSPGSDQIQVISPKVLAESNKEMVTNTTSMSETLNAAAVPKYPTESTPVKSYFPVYEPITPPDVASTTPEPINKICTSSLGETNPIPASHPSPMPATVNLNQGLSLLSSVKSTMEPSKFSFTSELKSPMFNQKTSETTSSSSTVFSKAFSFAPSIQKDPESSISKPIAANSTPASLPASGFQFGQKRDSFWVTSTTISSTPTSILKSAVNSSVTPESSNMIQQEKSIKQPSNTIFTISTSKNISPFSSEAKTASVSTPLVQTAEKKLSSYGQDSGDSAILPIKNSKGFSFESNKFVQVKNNDNTENSDIQYGEDLSITSTSVNKTVPSVTPPSSSQERSILADSLKSTNKSITSSTPSNQTVMNTVLSTDSLIGASNQTDISNSDLSILRQPVSSSDVTSDPINLSSSIAIVSATSTNPSSTGITVSSVISTETITSQLNLSLPKPPSPPMPTLLPEITSSSIVLPAQTVSTASVDNSKTCKPDASTASSEVKQTQIIELSQSETPLSFSSPKTAVSVPNETSITQISFGQPTSTTVPQETPFKDPASTPVTQATLFGQPSTVSVTQANIFAQPSSTTVTQPTLFGQPSSTTVTQPTLFGQPASAPVTQTFFGQPATTSTFSSTSGGFFSQTPSFGASDATSAVTTTNSDFNNQLSTFSFGKPAFGQATGSFGLAKSFGQNTTPFTQPATPSSFSFSQNSNTVFGQGSFFSGLGGKPSEENASKNVFGISSGVKSSDASNLFKNSSVKSFGAANGSSFTGAGGFTSGSGSVAQSGFGSFQQSPAQQPGGFGSAPTFGGSPAFGSPPGFGGSPTFGSGNSLSPLFGQQQVSSSFSNFANASSPTFGLLATQNTSFGSPQGFGSPTFGSAPAFGTSSFGSQPSGFGSPSPPSSNTSAFTQWRN